MAVKQANAITPNFMLTPTPVFPQGMVPQPQPVTKQQVGTNQPAALPAQPSASQSLTSTRGGTSTQQRGYGNTPTNPHATTQGGRPRKTAAAKSANALMGYGTAAGKMPMTGPMASTMPASIGMRMPTMMNSGAIPITPRPKMANYPGCGSGKGKQKKIVRPNSKMKKMAIVETGIAAGIGALSAPPRKRLEGVSRGVGRWAGLSAGGALGGLTGMGIGGGLGALVAGLLARRHLQPGLAEPASFGGAAMGAGLGGLAGLTGGAIEGWHRAGRHMGPASYDPANTKPDKGLDKKPKPKSDNKNTEKSSSAELAAALPLVDFGIHGAGLEAARAYSDRLPPSRVASRAGHGVVRGMAGFGGGALGALLGGLAGAGVGGLSGAGIGTLLRDPELARVLGFSGALGLGGLGAGIGGQFGGDLGFRLTRPKDEPDKARADMD